MTANNSTFMHGGATVPQPASGRNTTSESQKTKSEPSTPYQRPQFTMNQRRSPTTSNPTRDGSPRSLNSDQSRTPPAVRRPLQGCKFEAGMAQAKRRVPYSLGPDKLTPEPSALRKQLGVAESRKLTADMQELYEQLLPSPESEDRRSKFVNKLENLLRLRWPNTDIKVRVFGSTGNRLGTSDSDVDICITTDCKETENVCLIAELLEKNGMQRIVCVSSAKIPIVKAWDPEFQVSCDMNVNNPIALENTHMIRSYVLIDERVRPLAMIIKYWAKRRTLNDAALGGTLSSYTWICMVLNFLQTRQPPILPALQRRSGLQPVILSGVNVAFDKDMQAYKGFGTENKSSLGELLFDFFRYFGYELDFEANALSVRLGEVIPKSQKAWHLLQDNRLCVEEPFNISRNLANTADDTSMRGIHLDLRRAFKHIAEGDLAKCCEEFVPGPEEHRQTATFIHPTAARPVILQAPTQAQHPTHRNARNSYRGLRNNNNRNPGSRRASNPASRNPNYLHDLPFQMTPQELQLQAQHQQHLLHDQLFQQYQYLQLQEQELRMQLYQQNLRQRGIIASQTYQQPPFGGDNGIRLPMSPSVYQHRFGNTSPFLGTTSPSAGILTNPSSPLLGSSLPDGRRFARRTSLATSTAGSLRAHSQPARSIPTPSAFGSHRLAPSHAVDRQEYNSSQPSNVPPPTTLNRPYMPYRSESGTLYDAGRKPAEFWGYYVGQSPSLAAQSQSETVSPIPSHAGLAIQHSGLSPRLSSANSRVPSSMSSPSLRNIMLSEIQNPPANGTAPEYRWSPLVRDAPLIRSPKRRPHGTRDNLLNGDTPTVSTSASDDLGVATPSTSEDQFQDFIDKFPASMNGYYTPRQVMAGLPEQLESLSMEQKPLLNGRETRENGHKPIDVDSDQEAYLAATEFSGPVSMNGKTEDVAHIANGTSSKRKAKKTDRASLSTNVTPSHTLIAKTNGQESNFVPSGPARGAEISTTWQTQKKKKIKVKKLTKSEGDVGTINSAGGEMLPVDESLRKGG